MVACKRTRQKLHKWNFPLCWMPLFRRIEGRRRNKGNVTHVILVASSPQHRTCERGKRSESITEIITQNDSWGRDRSQSTRWQDTNVHTQELYMSTKSLFNAVIDRFLKTTQNKTSFTVGWHIYMKTGIKSHFHHPPIPHTHVVSVNHL